MSADRPTNAQLRLLRLLDKDERSVERPGVLVIFKRAEADGGSSDPKPAR